MLKYLEYFLGSYILSVSFFIIGNILLDRKEKLNIKNIIITATLSIIIIIINLTSATMIDNVLKSKTVDKFSVPSDMNANEVLEKLKKMLPERLYSTISREHELNEALKQEIDNNMKLADVKKDGASL